MNHTPPKAGEDYYVDELGRYVFTEAYHERRGYCCKSGCRHCPWGFRNPNLAGDKTRTNDVESGDPQ